MQPYLKRLRGLFLDLLFPPQCLGCNRGGAFLCPGCLAQLPRLSEPLCHRCGQPLAGSTSCRACAERVLSIDGIGSPFAFAGTMRQAIHKFKYQGMRVLAQPLGALLTEYWVNHPWPAEALVSVPLHPRRWKQRGFNQAALLAREVGGHTGLPVAEGLLRRTQDSSPQARLRSASERWANVSMAFVAAPQGISGGRFVLVDDVCTTGATLEGAARALKEAGASHVWGLTLAREV